MDLPVGRYTKIKFDHLLTLSYDLGFILSGGNPVSQTFQLGLALSHILNLNSVFLLIMMRKNRPYYGSSFWKGKSSSASGNALKNRSSYCPKLGFLISFILKQIFGSVPWKNGSGSDFFRLPEKWLVNLQWYNMCSLIIFPLPSFEIQFFSPKNKSEDSVIFFLSL